MTVVQSKSLKPAHKNKPKVKRDNDFRKLKSLPFFDEMHKKIVASVPVARVAKWIQEDKLQCLDVQRDSLIKMLTRYRNSLPPAAFEVVQTVFMERAIEKMNDGFDILEELRGLYLVQKKRISIDFELESKMNKLFNSTGPEIKIAMDLLGKILSTEQELGIAKNVMPPENQNNVMINMMGDNEDQKQKLGLIVGRLFGQMDAVKDVSGEAI